IPATAEGRVKIADGTTSVEIASGEATIRGIRAAIAQPSTLSIANGNASIEKLMLDVGGGSVTMSGTAGQTLDLAAEFSGLPAALANDFSPGLDAAGTLGGTAQVTGPSAAPDIRFDAQLSGAETSQTRQAGLGLLNLDAAGSFSSAGGVAIDRATLSGDKISGKAAGTINPNGASDFSLDLASGTVTANKIGLDNPTIAPLIAGKITAQVAGSLATDGIVIDSGSVTSDALNTGFNGRISLADGAIDLNLKTDAVSAALPGAARGLLAQRTELSAALKRDANGDVTANAIRLVSGALTADGQASLADNKLTVDIKGALADISLLSGDANGAITFALNAQGAST
ncbi:MAG: translocation/assembly module TamB, partial [Mesorhizobium sp.]